MRLKTEWLVLPLFFLPGAIAAGLSMWAKDAHRRARAPYRREGRAMAEEWLGPGGPAAWMRDRVVGFRDAPPPDGISFDHPVARARVRLILKPGPEPWSFAADLPSPLSPALLAQPGVRLDIETGRAPVEIEGAAEGAAALRALLETPDQDALRTAPLPPATKRYVLARWGTDGAGSTPPAPIDPPADEVERELDRRLDELLQSVDDQRVRSVRQYSDEFLAIVERFTAWMRERGAPLSPGAYHAGRLDVFASGPPTPPLIFPGYVPDRFRRRLVEEGPPDSPVRLIWNFPDGLALEDLEDDAGDLVWFGRIETPLAGEFLFQARWESWWQAPWVKRWAAPVAVLLLALFGLLGAIHQSLFKRRLLDEARVRFLNEMAHDLRTPLASLRLHADMLSEGRGKPEKQGEYLHLLSREAARLSSLLANLLDLSRLEQGRRRLEAGTNDVDVGALADRAARELVLLRPDREEDLHVEGPEKTWAQADATALSRCLANLLENAGKFTAVGTPIRVSWAPDGAEVVLRVADAGPGIPKGERRSVFERYARGKAARRDGVPGTGLGLSLVKELVEGMGGKVALLPSEVGAVFEIRLPRTGV